MPGMGYAFNADKETRSLLIRVHRLGCMVMVVGRLWECVEMEVWWCMQESGVK